MESNEESNECRVCGCTDDDCTDCVEATGRRCLWVEDDLCSACVATDAAHCLKMGPLSLAELAVQVGVSEEIVDNVLRGFHLASPSYFAFERPNGWKLTRQGYEQLLEAIR